MLCSSFTHASMMMWIQILSIAHSFYRPSMKWYIRHLRRTSRRTTVRSKYRYILRIVWLYLICCHLVYYSRAKFTESRIFGFLLKTISHGRTKVLWAIDTRTDISDWSHFDVYRRWIYVHLDWRIVLHSIWCVMLVLSALADFYASAHARMYYMYCNLLHWDAVNKYRPLA